MPTRTLKLPEGSDFKSATKIISANNAVFKFTNGLELTFEFWENGIINIVTDRTVTVNDDGTLSLSE